ncbi:MAG: hypothetical protein ABUS49_04790, partial [Acidobacteriota bacterium]
MSRIWDLLRQTESARPTGPSPRHPDLAAIAAVSVQLPPATRISVHGDPRGPCADRFRLLSLRVQERGAAEKLKTILITSPRPHDGKSTIALNLASALAERN